ncbi:unnamed protein product [Strongylus vulgaris]|uniref:Uncharacterized protein n=1 Tax=Strongylus vulgaris TaxID=40348 RepID=A0A3P7LUR9_STRVU|nr:unnamed protein product [Strongylus vulgaris]
MPPSEGRKKLGTAPNQFVLEARKISEQDFNDVFENVVEVAMCVEVHNTLFRRVRFPNVLRWQSCDTGPALSIVGNPLLIQVELNKDVRFIEGRGSQESPIVIRGNRKFKRENVDKLMEILKPYNVRRPQDGGQLKLSLFSYAAYKKKVHSWNQSLAFFSKLFNSALLTALS